MTMIYVIALQVEVAENEKMEFPKRNDLIKELNSILPNETGLAADENRIGWVIRDVRSLAAVIGDAIV